MVDTNMPAPKGRRKACDLCFMKKIKCDRVTPRCSHCKIYKAAACTYTPLKRTLNPNAIPRARADALEAKLKELEARLKAFEDQNASNPAERDSSTASQGVAGTDWVPVPPEVLALAPSPLPDLVEVGTDSLLAGGYPLPPLRDILPSVSEYFATCNRVVPLFHEPSFMRMLRNWYSTPITQQDPAAWAAINIVLALGRRHTYIDISSPRGNLDVHVQNAQSVLNQLITRDEDLLGIQVVLGLALVFCGTSDPRPAMVLIATASRLAHTLRLNTVQGSKGMDTETVTQRQRIFWILYVLDRDVALRISQPAMLHEQDIDLELPEEKSPDGVGIFCAKNGTSVNFLRKRVQFAWIQGKVYEWLFSVRAAKLPQSIRNEHRNRLERALDQWHASLPAEFRTEMLPDSSDTTTLRAFMVMHFLRLQVLAKMHHTYAYDSQWLETLRGFGDAAAVDGPTTGFGRKQLPESFGKLVLGSRENVKLFALLPQQDLYVVWSICCAFFSSLIILIVNNLAHPHHLLVDEDQRLVEFALQVLARLEEETGHENIGFMRTAIVELDAKTRTVVERARSHRLQREHWDVNHVASDFTSTVPSTFLDTSGSNLEDPPFAGDLGPASTSLDAELFSSWLETQYFDIGVSFTESAPLADNETPNFDRVVAVFVKQSWF